MPDIVLRPTRHRLIKRRLLYPMRKRAVLRAVVTGPKRLFRWEGANRAEFAEPFPAV